MTSLNLHFEEKFDHYELIQLSFLFCVSISLEERFFHVSNEESLKELISEGKGKQDIVFCFVQGLGVKGEKEEDNATRKMA